jgi:hypothetical protein
MCKYNFNLITRQGFKFIDTDTIVESTGLYGESVMHYLDATTFKEKK